MRLDRELSPGSSLGERSHLDMFLEITYLEGITSSSEGRISSPGGEAGEGGLNDLRGLKTMTMSGNGVRKVFRKGKGRTQKLQRSQRNRS